VVGVFLGISMRHEIKMASQEKKALYDLYPRLVDRIVNDVSKSVPSKERKRMTRKDCIRMVLDYSPNLLHSLDFMIMAEEHFWEREGSHAIFPESDAVLDNLLRAKYKMETSEGFSLPFDSFFLAIPHGYTHKGIRLQSFMVTMLPYLRSQEYTIFPFCKHIGLPQPKGVAHNPASENARCIALTYRDPENNIAYARALQTEDKLPLILQCETPEDFKSVIGSYQGKYGVIDLNENDLQIQFISMKLVAALGVYNMATEGSRLASGFPGKLEPRINNRSKDQRLAFSTLKNASKTEASEPDAREAFYRTWHFRQLRDERFYRGDYENIARGSRYTFVSDTVVGQKVTPHTQSISDELGSNQDAIRSKDG
jgi:hypothetical protein